MNLKAVITAETLAYSLHSIGIQIYYAKQDFVFEAPKLMAWVFAAVIIARTARSGAQSDRRAYHVRAVAHGHGVKS